MKKTTLLLAVAAMLIASSGCSCCRKKPRTVAMPVVQQCAPTCAPQCNSCGPGAPATYNYGMPSSTMSSPMMVPSTVPMAQ